MTLVTHDILIVLLIYKINKTGVTDKKKIKNTFRKTLYLTKTINILFKKASYLTGISESELARKILTEKLEEIIKNNQ